MPLPVLPLNIRVVQRARSEIGVHEDRGDNDGVPSIRYMGGRREPWCAHFVAWLFRQEGSPLPTDVEPGPSVANPLAGVSHMEGVFREQGWLVHPPVKPGDVVFFKNRGGSDTGPGRHVGIVEAVTRAGGIETIQTVEGNLGNKVGRAVYPVGHPRIASFGRVPGVDESINTGTVVPQPE